jgi:hypothetical protein
MYVQRRLCLGMLFTLDNINISNSTSLTLLSNNRMVLPLRLRSATTSRSNVGSRRLLCNSSTTHLGIRSRMDIMQ